MSVSRFTFVIEQTLGHITITKNWRKAVEADPQVIVSWLPIEFTPQSWPEKIPLIRNNWSLRGSIQARRAIKAAQRTQGRPDLYLFHTQVISLLSVNWLRRRTPVVISLDATPINYDRIGAAYGHQVGSVPVEKLKFWLNRRAMQGAARLISSSQWARQSLIDDYGISPSKIEVIPYGTDLAFWDNPGSKPAHPEGKVRLLFVGGDFERKGGKLLLDCFKTTFADSCELHLVTKAPVEASNNVFVYPNIQANSPELQAIFRQADIFVLPTEADCYPNAIIEAMAAGLPVVSTNIGAIDEMVQEGESGYLLPPRDGPALSKALTRLVEDAELRREMGHKARQAAEINHDAQKIGQSLLALCKSLSEAEPLPGSTPELTLSK